ncbi:MAG: hypothetical protein K6348_01330, partial [Deferribacterales bacterium]
GKDVDIKSHNVSSTIQDYSKDIKTSDVTNVFKQSIKTTTLSQSESLFWAKTYGGGKQDWLHSMQQTQDGGYIVTGYTYSFGAGNADSIIIKLDTYGFRQWVNTYGGSKDDATSFIQQTTDKGYIAAGYTKSFGEGEIDFLVMKISSEGYIVWAKTYGGVKDDISYSAQITHDGGYIIVGTTSSFGAGDYDILIVKIDSNGKLEWAKTYGGSNYERAYSIQPTTDNGYVVAGYTKSFGAGDYDALVIKLNSEGNVSWAKTYGGGKDDRALSMQQITDKGYIVAGMTASFGAGNWDAFVAKLNSDGNVFWAKTYGGSKDDWAFSIQKTTDGGYIAEGTTKSFSEGDADALILKIDSNGAISWARAYGGSKNDFAQYVQQTVNGDYIVGADTESFGEGYSDFLIIKLNSNGNIPGGSCDSLKNITSTLSVNSVTFTVLNQSPTIQMPSLASSSQDLTINSPNLSISTICESKTFTITAQAGVGGSISPSGTIIVDAGDHKTFTITPNNDYKIKDVKVDDVSVGAVSTYTFTNIMSNHTIEATFEKVVTQIIIILQIGNNKFTVNGKENILDSPPIIKNSRTLLPIRAIVEALGGTVGWDNATRKVTITLKDTTIELWIGKSIAKVNGVDTPIDAANPKVVPEIINQRTMLPLRFVTESLGCEVKWDDKTRTVTITYYP